MPKTQSWYEQNVPPINWHRAFITGMLGSFMMMMFVDIFFMMGITKFCFEDYVGSLILMNLYEPYVWSWGFVANLLIGGVFGLFYAFMFEFVFYRSNLRVGLSLGALHTIVAACAVFPFFKIVEDAAPVEIYPHFGILGSGLDAATPIILIFSHLIFGLIMGTFYGPVRMGRVRAMFEEPEDTVFSERLYEEERNRAA